MHNLRKYREKSEIETPDAIIATLAIFSEQNNSAIIEASQWARDGCFRLIHTTKPPTTWFMTLNQKPTLKSLQLLSSLILAQNDDDGWQFNCLIIFGSANLSLHVLRVSLFDKLHKLFSEFSDSALFYRASTDLTTTTQSLSFMNGKKLSRLWPSPTPISFIIFANEAAIKLYKNSRKEAESPTTKVSIVFVTQQETNKRMKWIELGEFLDCERKSLLVGVYLAEEVHEMFFW